ncbi:hypothetical protein OUZ56_030756 [Daphnia magna]|uniref:Uncharacterized protein n=1 Tax=Daphnia magna TaxID=35525 RepID=A0ABQ9ZS80_9CRUS|nr:hypothetical protein OUZ56_030756 [Daphnia magna]
MLTTENRVLFSNCQVNHDQILEECLFHNITPISVNDPFIASPSRSRLPIVYLAIDMSKRNKYLI